MKRRNLVVVRAGRTSLHGRWLELPYVERNYDLIVSYYDEDAFNAFETEDGARAVLGFRLNWRRMLSWSDEWI